MQRLYDKYEQIELLVAANLTANKFNFPDIPQLRSDSVQDIIVTEIEIFSEEQTPFSYNGNACAALADLQKCFLTLYIDDRENVFRVPLVKMIANYASGIDGFLWQTSPFGLNQVRVDWTKSYIQTYGPSLGNGAPLSFTFGINYSRFPAGYYSARQKALLAALNLPQTV